VNSLSQLLLKIATPGVTDFYQGDELWDLRLVDPDNRSPVNFERRTAMLKKIACDEAADSAGLIGNMLEHWHDGRIKLFLLWKAIRFRREHAALFQDGEFLPLETRGDCQQHVVCFMRRSKQNQTVVAVPRWLSQVASAAKGQRNWHNTEVVLPPDSPDRWRSVVSGQEVTAHQARDKQSWEEKSSPGPSLRVDDLLKHFPVAFFSSVG